MNKIEALQGCTVEGNNVKLPDVQLDRNVYMEVKKALELIGGKWKSGKVQAFVFEQDPTELLQEISGGENRNLKKEFQFFATPDKLADRLVSLADIREPMIVLEPSAGQGAIIAAIYRAFPHYMKGPNDKSGVTVDYYELMPVNRQMLSKRLNADERWSSSTSCMGEDFLPGLKKSYERIVANPPFTKNQDIDHIREMWNVCKPGGRIVTVASNHWRTATDKKCKMFKDWLWDLDGEIIDLEPGEFKESGTNIAACILVIDK